MYLRALQDITNSTEATINPLADEEDSADHAFEFSFVSTIVAAIILLMCLREFYVRRYGVDFCPAFQMFHFTGSNHRPGQSQVDRDRAYAQEVQRQLDLENHEAELEAKRKDRKEWYEAYVVPFTMVSCVICVAFSHTSDWTTVVSLDSAIHSCPSPFIDHIFHHPLPIFILTTNTDCRRI